ncbi:MAG TPA: type II toxin-antitoxin system PemK/MazF family toxin [Verrucomicrobiae bacterium]
MKPWEIWSYQPPGWPEAHPAVIVSSLSRVANKPDINVLMCSSKRASREATPVEVILDTADGLSWPTFCKCDLLHLVSKAELKNRRGQVTDARRRQIILTINRSNGWFEQE